MSVRDEVALLALCDAPCDAPRDGCIAPAAFEPGRRPERFGRVLVPLVDCPHRRIEIVGERVSKLCLEKCRPGEDQGGGERGANEARRTYRTFHSCTPAETPGCIVNSIRSAEVVTGLNVSVFQPFLATPNGSLVATGFHVSPSL